MSELFEELDAFCPTWQKDYDTVEDAAMAARVSTPYVWGMFLEWKESPEGQKYIREVLSVPDIRGAIRRAREAEEESPAFRSAMSKLNSMADGSRY